MDATRKGMFKKVESLKQKRRRYRIHANLKKKDNCSVVSRKRTVILKKMPISEIENKWITELKGYGYGITASIFSEGGML